MSIFATVKRYEEAQSAYENIVTIYDAHIIAGSEWKKLTRDYLQILYFKSVDNEGCIAKLLDLVPAT